MIAELYRLQPWDGWWRQLQSKSTHELRVLYEDSKRRSASLPEIAADGDELQDIDSDGDPKHDWMPPG